jgi:CheY-like chemotaxis protein
VVDAQPKSILVVEDDAGIRSLLEHVLEQYGYSVAVAASGQSAVDQMRTHRPDLILLDLMMPDMTGHMLLKLRERERELARVPVLVVSAAEMDALAQAQELGAPVFVRKPFDIAKLMAEVQRLTEAALIQCAWCGRVVDELGEFRLRSGRKLRWASHGICPVCKEAETRDLVS